MYSIIINLMKKLLILSLAAALLAACGDGPALSRHQVKPLTLSAQEQEICKKQNDYSLELLKVMAADNQGNLFISPLSASIVCAMLANGANGATQDEILRAIGCEGYTMSELNAHFLNLMECLPYQDATTYLALANAVFVDEGYPIESAFQDNVETHYLAEVANIELSDPASANVINTWASKNTQGMISKLCDGSYFDDNLRLVLMNALCFKGKWEEQFKKTDTDEQTFYAPTGSKQVKMMHAELEKAHATGDYIYDSEGNQIQQDARVLRLYYKDQGYCMDVVLPREDLTLADILPDLSVEWIDMMLRHAMPGAKVGLPRFKMEAEYRLNEPMQALGMQTVFSEHADLTGISTATRLYLALLQQNTFIEVDEQGTKAAAVTSAWAKDSAMPSDPFICDRPFAYFIRDVKHGIILFAGCLSNPK